MPAIVPDGIDPPTPEDLVDYHGIGTLCAPEANTYWAFTDDYIIFCVSPTGELFYETLDLILYGRPSLAGTTNFTEAQGQLPEERVLMFYGNVTAICPELSPSPDIPPELWGNITSILPPYMASSVSFDESGTVSSFYCPRIEGMLLPDEIDDNMLNSTQIVPGDALLFYSIQDANATWQEMEPLIEGNWGNIGNIGCSGNRS